MSINPFRTLIASTLVLLAGASLSARAAGEIALFDPALPQGGWAFDNGQEFPGATGKLSIDQADGNALRLDGNFSKGFEDFGARLKAGDVP